MFAFWNICFFWVPWLISVILLLISTVHVYKLLHGFKYHKVPPPSQIIPYFETHPDPDNVLQDAHLGLIKEYAESVDYNYEQNNKRKITLLRGQKFAFSAFAIFVVFCIPKWGYSFTHNEQEIMPVKIVSAVPVQLFQEKQMSDTTVKTSSSVQQTTNQSSTQIPQTPVTQVIPLQAKPSFPKSSMSMDSAENIKPIFPKSSMALAASAAEAGSNKNSEK